MNIEEAAANVAVALQELGIPSMLVGSFSSMYYGVPRFTNDADLVIEWDGKPLTPLQQKLGERFRIQSQLSFETATGTVRHLIELADQGFKIELFHLSEDPHDRERFRRRSKRRILGRDIDLPTPEDVIVTKLRWALLAGRAKDREDVAGVLAVQGDALDFDYIHSWCDKHGTRALLDEIRASIPPID